MKRILFLYICLALSFGSCTILRKSRGEGTSKGTMQRTDSIAYAFGLLNAEPFSRLVQSVPGDTLSIKHILLGLSDGVEERSLAFSKDVAHQVFQSYIKELQERKNTQLKAENDSVLRLNKTKEGVVTTESGLQYRILKLGKGPTIGSVLDSVVVHYVGRLVDGTEFDNSYKRQQPAHLKVSEVIDGWAEALKLMPIGSKFELYIPASLAYKEHGAGDAIPPYATLVFEIELLQIIPNKNEQNEELDKLTE